MSFSSDGCRGKPCRNGGTCSSLEKSLEIYCTCTSGWNGDLCTKGELITWTRDERQFGRFVSRSVFLHYSVKYRCRYCNQPWVYGGACGMLFGCWSTISGEKYRWHVVIIFRKLSEHCKGIPCSQRTHDAIIKSLSGRNDVATSFWCNNDVIIA